MHRHNSDDNDAAEIQTLVMGRERVLDTDETLKDLCIKEFSW